jgi:hypothetical protein
VAHTFNASYSGSRDRVNHGSRPAQTKKSETLSEKYSTQKFVGRAAQVVECLHRKCEALNSNPSTTEMMFVKCFSNTSPVQKCNYIFHNPVVNPEESRKVYNLTSRC